MENVSTIATRIIRISYILLLILVPLFLTPWNYELFEYNKMMLTYGLAVIIGSSWIIKMIADREVRISRTPLDIPILLFVLSQLVSTLFSMDPHISWFGYYSRFNGGMMSIFTYVLLYYGLTSNFISHPKKSGEDRKSNIEDGKTLTRLIQVMVVTGLIVALYGVAEHFGIDKNLWIQDVINRVFSTLGQPNWLAAYLVALSPIAWGLAIWKIEYRKSNIFYLLISIVFFITLLWTRSRSGLLSFAVVDLLFWLILFTDKNIVQSKKNWLSNRWKQWPQRIPFLLINCTFLIIICINGTYIENVDTWVTLRGWQNRLIQVQKKTESKTATSASEFAENNVQPPVTGPLLETGGTESGTIRKYVWQGAINAWKSSTKTLLIGTGTETYAFAFYQFKPVGHNLTSEWDFLYNKAHNEYLNYLATTGVFGLGTYLLLIGSFLYWFIKNLYSKVNIHNSEFIILNSALFTGWLSILITNFFGFSVVIIQILFFLLPAIIFCLDTDALKNSLSIPLSKNDHVQKGVISAVISIGLLLLGGLSLTWYADKLYATGYHLSKAGYMTQAYQNLTSAITYNPTEPLYRDELSSVLSSLALAAGENEATLSGDLMKLAVKESDHAIATSPNNVNFYKTRTKVLYALSSFDPAFLPQAIRALEKARDLSPSDPKIFYNLAILYGREGNLEQAVSALKTAIDLKPNYRDAYLGLTLFYQEAGQSELAKETALSYITKVDPNDEEMKGYAQ